jgi:hypothetical protein
MKFDVDWPISSGVIGVSGPLEKNMVMVSRVQEIIFVALLRRTGDHLKVSQEFFLVNFCED